jgi:hypothetical protein
MRAYLKIRNSRRGSAMVMFSLMIPTVIVPLAGLGIDATMLYIVQAKLAAAVDGAALGAGRLLGTQADPSEIAGEFLRANFRVDTNSGFWGATHLVPTVNVTMGTTKTIHINATVDVPLLFSRIFGQPKATVAASATSTRRDSRVILVVDRSGSMNTSDGAGSTVIADVVSYSQGFVQKFTAGTDELGLVVFDGSAVVGYPTVRPWDSTTTAASTGGANSAFMDGTTNDMVHQIQRITAGSGTGMAEALWLAYIELQKAHMKDLAARGSDDRLNSIVLFTDGVPSAMTLYLNNPANANADNVIKPTSTCTNKTITVQDAAHMMLAWFAIPGPPYTNGGVNTYGLFLNASTDPAATHTAQWWMGQGGSDAARPNPSTPYTGCTSMYADDDNAENTSLPGFLTQIPASDRYGNSLTGNGYTNSHIVKSNGTTSSVYSNGVALDRSHVDRDYHWGLAVWNSVDSAAARIRADVNRPNRGGDLQNMAITIFTIGYLGNGGTDDGLLKRVANDKSAAGYDNTQSTGRYIPASDKNALANAFDTLASIILRLSQ